MLQSWPELATDWLYEIHSAPHKIIKGIQVRWVGWPKLFGPESLWFQFLCKVCLGGLDVCAGAPSCVHTQFLTPYVASKTRKTLKAIFELFCVYWAFCPVGRKHFSISSDHAEHHHIGWVFGLAQIPDSRVSNFRDLRNVSCQSRVADSIHSKYFFT